MILSNNIGGMSFCGADVGGFFGNPTPELLVRWYQAGAFMPFFRAHAHIDTKRREPYLLEQPYQGYVRDAIRIRYQLLPAWYNAFHDASVKGLPIVRPQYAVFPADEGGFAIDDQYYIGSSGLLFKPVTTEGATTTSVYLSDSQPYYDYHTHRLYPSSSSSRSVAIDTPLSSYPLLLQGGNIIPTRQRVRRASSLMWQDPFTLTVALSKQGTANGQLYFDDGVSFDHLKGGFVWRRFTFEGKGKSGGVLASTHMPLLSTGSLSGTALATYDEADVWTQAIGHVKIERIVVLGMKSKPKSVSAAGVELNFSWEDGTAAGGKKEGTASRLTIKNPGVGVVDGWAIVIE